MLSVDNCHLRENIVLDNMKSNCVNRKDIGSEYFQGNITDIINIVIQSCNYQSQCQ